MGDISKLNIGNFEYNLKDLYSRQEVENINLLLKTLAKLDDLDDLEADIIENLESLRETLESVDENTTKTIDEILAELNDPASPMKSFLDTLSDALEGLDSSTTVKDYLDEVIESVKESIDALTSEDLPVSEQDTRKVKDALDGIDTASEGVKKRVDFIWDTLDVNVVELNDTKMLNTFTNDTWEITSLKEIFTAYGDRPDNMIGGTLMVENANPDNKIVISPDDFAKYPKEKWTPIGVVVIPAFHNVYGTGESGIVSLAYMNCQTPTTGGNSQEMPLGPASVDIPNLPQLKYVPTCGSGSSQADKVTGKSTWPYLPSEIFASVGVMCKHDVWAYYKEANSTCAPSPYITGGARNPMYYQTEDPAPADNCLADFDGRGNTDKILAVRGVKDYSTWKPTYYQANTYPAASCCDMFSTIGTKQGDWYLPAMGELGYLMARANTIALAMYLIYQNYGVGINLALYNTWSSTGYNYMFGRMLNLSDGNADNNSKETLCDVLAFYRYKGVEIVENPKYEFVDMGLSVNWATCNVGASKPEEYGLYFAWGETEGYESAVDKEGGFSWNSLKYCLDSNGNKFSKYVTNASYGEIDNKTTLGLEDDAAHVNMGGEWRMPTQEEFQELYDACNTTWVDNYNGSGINGELFTLKTDSSKQVFFPAAGFVNNSSILGIGSYGYYSFSSLSTTSGTKYAYGLNFVVGSVNQQGNNFRYIGRSVRGVLPK